MTKKTIETLEKLLSLNKLGHVGQPCVAAATFSVMEHKVTATAIDIGTNAHVNAIQTSLIIGWEEHTAVEIRNRPWTLSRYTNEPGNLFFRTTQNLLSHSQNYTKP